MSSFERPSRRPSGLRLLSIALLALIGAGFGLRALIVWRGEVTIERHEAEITPLLACSLPPVPAPPAPHPWGTDNVWDLLHPAFEALWEVQTIHASKNELRIEEKPEYAKHGDPEHWARVLQAEEAHFQACRRAEGRSARNWVGPRDPEVDAKGLLAGQHLCTKAFFAWREGRDEEAIDWLITALTVAQETERLEQLGVRAAFRTVEQWAYEALRLLLSKHGLGAAQLEILERRLDRLRSSRPRPIRDVPRWGAQSREAVLNEPTFAADAGWRDLFSEQVRKARLLTAIRDSAAEAELLPWTSAAELEPYWNEVCRGFHKEIAGQAWSMTLGFLREYAALLRWDLLRVAVGAARFEAAKGRMPATLDEAGVGGILRRPATLEGDAIRVTLLLPGTPANPYGSEFEDADLVWTIGRRQR